MTVWDILCLVLAGLLGLGACLEFLFWLLGPGADAGSEPGPIPRVLVLIPAHNEASLLPGCLESLARQDVPRQDVDVVVLADRCRDATADVARRAGADVLERSEGEPGKGSLLQWAIPRVLAEHSEVEAVGILDADSRAHSDWLRQCLARMAAGADLVQAHHAVIPGRGGALGLWMRAGAAIRRRVLGARDRMGLSCPLLGTGMLLRRSLLEGGWPATGLTEDLEMGVRLLLQGHPAGYQPNGCVEGEPPEDWRAGRTQRIRWIRGESSVSLRYALPLILRGLGGSWPALEMGWRLLIPGRAYRLAAAMVLAAVWALEISSYAGAAWLPLLLDLAPPVSHLLSMGPAGAAALTLGPALLVWKLWLLLVSCLPGARHWRPTRGDTSP